MFPFMLGDDICLASSIKSDKSKSDAMYWLLCKIILSELFTMVGIILNLYVILPLMYESYQRISQFRFDE